MDLVLKVIAVLGLGLLLLTAHYATAQSTGTSAITAPPSTNTTAVLDAFDTQGVFTTRFITHNANLSIAIFIGPDNVKQPEEDTTDVIAQQFGFRTLVYEFTAEGQLIIVLTQ